MSVVTAAVVTLKTTARCPAATITVAGTVTAGSDDNNETTNPPAGAFASSVTIPRAALPPLTADGLMLMLVICGAITVRVADTDVPLTDAVIVAVALADTGTVVIVNVPVVVPAGIVTVAGTPAATLLDPRLTTTPPTGALLSSVTIPVAELPPATPEGEIVTLNTRGATTVRTAAAAVPFAVAVIVAEVFADTGTVVTVNVAVVAPSGTVTVAGTPAAALLLERLTNKPPVGATLSRVIMPVAVAPPVTPAGVIVMAETRGAVTVRSAFAAVPLDEAVIVADAFADTATVVIVNVALVAPSATVTLAGTDAAALLDARLTTTPPAGAA